MLPRIQTVLTIKQPCQLDFYRGARLGVGELVLDGDWRCKIKTIRDMRLQKAGVFSLEVRLSDGAEAIVRADTFVPRSEAMPVVVAEQVVPVPEEPSPTYTPEVPAIEIEPEVPAVDRDAVAAVEIEDESPTEQRKRVREGRFRNRGGTEVPSPA